jgi:hypothetical protein
VLFFKRAALVAAVREVVMTTQEIAQMHLTSASAIPSTTNDFTTVAGQLPPIEDRVMRLEGPSTLTLALIGAATLATYRGVQKRLTSRATAVDAVRQPIKPRRRAA